MHILLIADLFSSEFSTGIFVLKNLQQLGFNVKVWDVSIMTTPPQEHFDICINWTNKSFDLNLVDADKKVLYYLEDSDYIKGYDEELTIDKRKEGYDYVFTMNLLPGYEDNWLPMGCDPALHGAFNMPKHDKVVLFLGTARDERRKSFVKQMMEDLAKDNIGVLLAGNGWEDFPNYIGKPFYMKEFTILMNQFKIVINFHIAEQSPSDKVHAIIGCGGALLLNDNKKGYVACYPDAPTWSTLDELKDNIKLYLNNEDERLRQVAEMQKRSHNLFSYRVALKKLLEKVNETD